jgi:hypothetical protein
MGVRLVLSQGRKRVMRNLRGRKREEDEGICKRKFTICIFHLLKLGLSIAVGEMDKKREKLVKDEKCIQYSFKKIKRKETIWNT